MTDSCENCIYFLPERDFLQEEFVKVLIGVCRRWPPRIIESLVRGGVNHAARFPFVRIKMWCGEWRAKPADDKDGDEFEHKCFEQDAGQPAIKDCAGDGWYGCHGCASYKEPSDEADGRSGDD